MKKNLFTTLILMASLIFTAMQSSAQHGGSGHGRGIDSSIIRKLDSIINARVDSFKAHHSHDTIPTPPPPPPPPPHHRDSIPPHPMDTIRFGHFNDSLSHAWIDSIRAHCKRDSINRHSGNDTIPPPPPPPPHPHDSIPPFPHDSIIPPPPPPPHPHGHDSIPPPPDSTGCCGGHGFRIEGSFDNSNVSAMVYPNPIASNSALHISNSTGGLTFRMFDVTGKIVMLKENLGNGDYSINRSELGSGVYFYDIYSGNTKLTSGKLLVQ